MGIQLNTIEYKWARPCWTGLGASGMDENGSDTDGYH